MDMISIIDWELERLGSIKKGETLEVTHLEKLLSRCKEAISKLILERDAWKKSYELRSTDLRKERKAATIDPCLGCKPDPDDCDGCKQEDI